MAIPPGTRIGPYEIVGALGAGGMGEVYRARDTRLGRDAAIKILPEAFAQDPERLRRFEREARTLASLNHPHIAQIYGLEQLGSSSALVMELVDGEDLSQRLARGAMPLDEALPIARQVAEALESAHEQGIIHRDLKPANIKVRDDGSVKVLDFGLAKALEQKGASQDNPANSPTLSARATALGMILGTAAYMAPEQAKGKTVDRRADVWAFGAVLYEMLTGRRAFEGTDVSETLASVLRDTPAFDALPSSVPVPIRRLLRRCLERDGTRRLDSMSAARLEIADALDPSLAGGGAASADTAAHPSPSHRRRRRLARVAAAAALILLSGLAGAGAFYLSAGPRPDAQVIRFEIPTPPTDDIVSLAMSPDGSQLAFVAKGENGPQLWIRRLDRIAVQPLPGTEGASYPFWSPDGRAVGFFADSKLKRLDLAAGAPVELASAPSARGGTWGPQNVILYSPTVQSGLYRIPAGGGASDAVTQTGAESGASHRWPQFLPDGRFLFYVYQGPVETRGVYVGSLGGSPPLRVMASDGAALFAPPDVLLLPTQDALVAWRFDTARAAITGEPITVAQGIGDGGVYRAAVAVSDNGRLVHRAGGGQRRQLTWLDRSGRTVSTLGPPDERWLAGPELSPDERQVAVFREVRGDTDVWLVDVARGSPNRFTFDPANDSNPLWSADGAHLFFASGRTGKMDVFVKPSDGAVEERPLLTNEQSKWPLSVSTDRRFLLYRGVDPRTKLDLWVLPLEGDGKPFPYLQTPFDESEGQFSPDGRWVAYVSNESGSRPEVYVRSFQGVAGKWQVSTGGGTQVRWGRDGQELFFLAPDGRLMAAPFVVRAGVATPDPGVPVPLFMTRLASGSNVTGLKPQYSVARDGRFLMAVALEDLAPPPITVVLNWQAALKKP
jgi:Tol biopolymer transport system component